MRIVFLSPDEPFYLPGFYKNIFERLSSAHEARVVIVPPVYKNTTKLGLTIRYAKTFGLREAAALSAKVIRYKLMDKLKGGKGERFYSLESLLERYRIPYTHETDLNSPESLERLRAWKTDLIVSVSCPQIFKKDLIELAPLGCLNLHGSLLPDYRGVMPSFWVLANAEREAGITLFFVNEKIDAGDVLVQRKYSIEPGDTLDSIIARSKKIGSDMVLEAIDKIEKGNTGTRPLDMKKGRYFGWPKRDDVRRFIGNGRRFR
jgi:methionyl-tRNA formyltransferase